MTVPNWRLPILTSCLSTLPIYGALGYSLKVSLMTLSRYFISLRSCMVTERSEPWKMLSCSWNAVSCRRNPWIYIWADILPEQTHEIVNTYLDIGIESQIEESPRYRSTCRFLTLWDMKIRQTQICFLFSVWLLISNNEYCEIHKCCQWLVYDTWIFVARCLR